MNKERSRLADDLADVVTGRPHDFYVGQEQFLLWPLTLAKTFLLQPYMEALGLADGVKSEDPRLTYLRLARNERDMCCMVIAICTTENSREAFMDTEKRKERCRLLAGNISEASLATMLGLVLSSDKTDSLLVDLGIDSERKRAKGVLAVKKNRNNVSFFGKTVFGAFIAQLKEMGFSIDEILYECSYSFLRLVLADKQVDVYLSDDELAQLPGSTGALIDGESPDADRQLKAYAAAHLA